MRFFFEVVLLCLVVSPTLCFEFLKPSYWQQQQACVKLLSTIPRGSKVLEIDAMEGAKYLYYLPFGCSVTQWARPKNMEKNRGPTSLAASKLGLTVDFVRAEQIPETLNLNSFDAAVSVGAVTRAEDPESATQLVEAVMRALAPGGRLYFLESPAEDAEKLLSAALDANDMVKDCVASTEKGAIIGVVTKVDGDTTKIEEKNPPPRGMGTTSKSASSKKKRRRS